MPHTTFLVAGAAILSFGAVYLVGRPEEWPDGVPSRSYYEGVWQSDARHRALQPRAQYLARVLKFYSGSAGRPGSVLRGELPSSALTPARYEARVLTMEAPR